MPRTNQSAGTGITVPQGNAGAQRPPLPGGTGRARLRGSAASAVRRSGAAVLVAAALALPHDAGAADWSRALTVTVVAVDYRFTPSRLVFRAGQPYRLQLVDRGKEIHDLTAPAFFKTVRLRDTGAMNEAHTGIAVGPGEAKDLYFVPQRPGHYPFACADHDWAGMVGEIAVE